MQKEEIEHVLPLEMSMEVKAHIETRDKGYCLVASKDLVPEEVIYDIAEGGKKMPKRDKYTIQCTVGIDLEIKHIDHPLGRTHNHSCDPNCSVDRSLMIAIKEIKQGEELTFNYLHNEDEIASGFKCSCGAINCAGQLGI